VAAALPDFIEPMLAKLGQPFDGEGWWFEPKWDGIRALAFVEGGRVRLMTRRRLDVVDRYPELAPLARLPAGTVLDGEVVAFVEGKPDFFTVLRRERPRGPLRRAAPAAVRATYAAFDVLYEAGRSVMAEPLRARRERLERLLLERQDDTLALVHGVAGAGRALFAATSEQALEGVVGKRLDSAYEAGRRSGAWVKVKRSQQLLCVIIGYLPAGPDDMRSLIVAAPDDSGVLRCVGKVGSGLSEGVRRALVRRLRGSSRGEPIVETAEKGTWVEPELFCTVSFLERTQDGNLRAPVFVRLEEGGGEPSGSS
jgi:bifunctional non-homologous end joining protein LigD